MNVIKYFDLISFLIFALIWIWVLTFLRLKKKKSLKYLILFTIFYIYIFKVLDYTLLQFQSLILLKFFIPNLILRGQTAENSLNLLPLITLTPQDLNTSLLNILLFIPFGLGLPFITNFNFKKIILAGILFSLLIELIQLLSGLLANITFRIADINDLIFNSLGAVLGYLLYKAFKYIFHKKSHKIHS